MGPLREGHSTKMGEQRQSHGNRGTTGKFEEMQK